MMGTAFAKIRSLVIRGVAVAAVILTYAFGGVVTKVATAVGVSTILLSATSTPAQAWYRRRWRRRYYRVYPRRRWYRRRWRRW
ncbi:MAG: hypothetical protein QOD74_379 [Variibacter sp.]|jgi:hypothetical protein|nr:hypothetical protein [Variibacter sp.]